MLTPMMGNRLPEDRVWAVDTGCFAAPEKFDPDRYIAWLKARREHVDRCLFATAPDVFGDGPATLRAAAPMLPRIRAAGFPAALVVQPGVTIADMPWDAIDAVFVGGPDAWQASEEVRQIVREARRRGKHTHRGRVNSLRRLRASMEFDSADGTYIAFGGDKNVARVADWIDALHRQPALTGLLT